MKESPEIKSEIEKKFEEIKSGLDIDAKRSEKQELEAKLNSPDIWKDRPKADKIVRDLKAVTSDLELVDDIDSQLSNKNPDYSKIKAEIDQLETKTLFSGKYDAGNAYLSISAGTGGTDAQDWAEILLRMYLRFAEKMNWKTQILSKIAGGEAGIKNAQVYIFGNLAYGYLKNEAGVHRLVRRSPFNANNLRQTSFALVEVTPEIEKSNVEIKEDDLKIDTFRSSGHGGQSVNTTDSAVRVTHLPTKISVSCQNERSQLQNKETALKILKSKLTQVEEEKRGAELEAARGEIKAAKWGNQIRSYVFDPYKLVKDHRTDHKEKDVGKVLDGNIEDFIVKYLKVNKKGK